MRAHTSRPLVACALPKAIAQAERHGVSGVLENRVAEALEAAGVDPGDRSAGRDPAVRLGGGLVVLLRPIRSPLTGRRGFQPTTVYRER